jgi:hypothetical protein
VTATPAVAAPRRPALGADAAAGVLLAVAALVLRFPFLGDPGLHVDEQFYLLVGERLLDGALPYVDIWDRKPIGLFLIYALAALTPGTSVVAYQLLATGFAAATAWLIYRMADRLGARHGAIGGALLYLVWLTIFQGWGGQSPVFYNLFVAGAALLTLELLLSATATPREVLARGAVAMLLFGIAIQIKYTVIFEGMVVGLLLLWRLRAAGAGLGGLAAGAALWVGVALAPTALALLAYAAAGHGEAFVYANFVSIFEKASETGAEVGRRLERTLALLSPLLVLAALAAARLSALRRPAPAAAAFVLLWAAGAVAGYLSVGNLYYHYALPLLPPLCVAAGLGLGRFRFGPLLMVAVAAYGWAVGTVRFANRQALLGSGAEVAAAAAAVRPQLQGGCLFVFDGPPLLYALADACAPTRYVFPYHLSIAIEAAALGVDPVAETRRILAARPAVVVDTSAGRMAPNPATLAVLRAALARDYALLRRLPLGARELRVYALRRGRASALADPGASA